LLVADAGQVDIRVQGIARFHFICLLRELNREVEILFGLVPFLASLVDIAQKVSGIAAADGLVAGHFAVYFVEDIEGYLFGLRQTAGNKSHPGIIALQVAIVGIGVGQFPRYHIGFERIVFLTGQDLHQEHLGFRAGIKTLVSHLPQLV
jgi:hypothetical protein